ncbi:MAG: NAD(P)H-hydrate epimerase [Planctomycetia bacterium]
MRSLTRAEVRDVDRRAIEEFGLPGIVLMENAGRNAAALLHDLAPRAAIAIVCGRGNNGGDGFVMARHLERAGHAVRLLLACDPATLAGDAATNHRVAVAARIPLTVLAAATETAWAESLAAADWVVDALHGTGAAGPARGPTATAIAAVSGVRAAGVARVFAVDLPSGLDCDTGRPLGPCVRADVTGTFVARKIGFDAPGADEFTGAVHVLDIGVPLRLLADLGLA